MNKIIQTDVIDKVVEKIKKLGKTIVLVGGCFDILHVGHTLFLETAKKEGDFLFVLLESDENTKKKKGEGRPINSQKKRTAVLCALKFVDYVIPLIGVTKNEDYDKLIVQIKPDVIAMTKGEPGVEQRKKQAVAVGAELKLVIDRVKEESTTGLIKK